MKNLFFSIIRFITSSSALLLFASFFMPAVSGCNKEPVYPYKILSLNIYLPYLWSGSVFIMTLLLKMKNIKIQKFYFNVHLILILIWITVWGYTLHKEIQSATYFSLDLIYPYFIWWISVIVLPVQMIKKRQSGISIFWRSTWIGALMANSLYVLFIIESHFYGLTISFIASIVLFILAVLEDNKDKIGKIFL